MDFEKANELVQGIHDQNGDSTLMTFSHQLKKSIIKSNSFREWNRDIQERTDLTQDFKWGLEEFSESFKVIFILMGKGE